MLLPHVLAERSIWMHMAKIIQFALTCDLWFISKWVFYRGWWLHWVCSGNNFICRVFSLLVVSVYKVGLVFAPLIWAVVSFDTLWLWLRSVFNLEISIIVLRGNLLNSIGVGCFVGLLSCTKLWCINLIVFIVSLVKIVFQEVATELQLTFACALIYINLLISVFF